MSYIDRKISIAPMMDCTDRHDRYFLRLIAPHVLLYTEMITAPALIHGDVPRHLDFHPAEHPIALQLGGSDPKVLAECAKLGAAYGYDEINLNVGCPSDRVKSGQFGACLMLNPDLVAECVNAMISVVNIPVTIKCRIGVDHQDSYESLVNFIGLNQAAGCRIFIVHARKAWLKGLSPKEDREIPPLEYSVVYQLKKDFPQLTFILNGGIKTLEDIDTHLKKIDGVMIGREAYSNPYFLADIEKTYYPSDNFPSRREIIYQLIPYIENHLKQGNRLSHISRHILGLYHGEPNSRLWRRYLSERSYSSDAGIGVLLDALAYVEPA